MHKILKSIIFKCFYCDCLQILRNSKIFKTAEVTIKNQLLSNQKILPESTKTFSNKEINKSSPFIFTKETAKKR